jgi:hypothetical protein
LVTNRKDAGDKVIWWLRERCGKSEEVHSVMKSDLAGGQLPSGQFGANSLPLRKPAPDPIRGRGPHGGP